MMRASYVSGAGSSECPLKSSNGAGALVLQGFQDQCFTIFWRKNFSTYFVKKSGRIAAPGVLKAPEYKGLRVLAGDIPLKTRLVQMDREEEYGDYDLRLRKFETLKI
ncbi:hypothetical protein WR25_25601 [Diploscapter pachys]|uniref:Uncharacterized protein n=1 Tax=Diploscapter pachys TaxID=2018661 RepID=A0A2A2JZL9_9BILA|nr:hypothetical protein WR25_25601 [Diploscapter pachys]